MDYRLYTLSEKIELLRENLLIMVSLHKLSSPIVVELSQKLDMLLLEYEKAIIEYKKAS